MVDKKDAVVPAKKIPMMFSKLEEIHKVNFELLAKFEVCSNFIDTEFDTTLAYIHANRRP